jgi:hypothetical protein
MGDLQAELAASDTVVDERYRRPEEHCSAMELHSATAWRSQRTFDPEAGATITPDEVRPPLGRFVVVYIPTNRSAAVLSPTLLERPRTSSGCGSRRKLAARGSGVSC